MWWQLNMHLARAANQVQTEVSTKGGPVVKVLGRCLQAVVTMAHCLEPNVLINLYSLFDICPCPPLLVTTLQVPSSRLEAAALPAGQLCFAHACSQITFCSSNRHFHEAFWTSLV